MARSRKQTASLYDIPVKTVTGKTTTLAPYDGQVLLIVNVATFPLFAKIAVNGPEAHPLYELLKAARPGALGTRAIKWNFTKFLVGRDGAVLRRYAPKVTPEDLEADVSQSCATPSR